MTTLDSTVPPPLVKVLPTTPTPDAAHVGFRMAMWGNLVVTGAWPENHFVGAAYVFETEAWSQVARLEAPSDTVPGAYFGTGVSIWDDIVVVGRVELNFWQNPGTGSAVVFKRGQGGFEKTAELRANDGVAAALFGADVAVYEDLVVCGAPQDTNEDGEVSGATYLFRTDDAGLSWSQVAKLVPNERLAHRYFGMINLLDDSFLFVGAADVDILSGSYSAVGKGSVFVYDRTGELVVTLEASDGGFGDEFGATVKRDDDLCVVGAPRHFDGAVYLFNTTTWDQIAKLNSSHGGGQYFGQAVDVKDGTILVGSNIFGLPDGDPGRAEVFMHRNSSWTSFGLITTSSANDFGTYAVLGDDGMALVSAMNARNGDGVASGCIYVYNIPESFKEPMAGDSSSSSSKSKGSRISVQETLLVVVIVVVFCLLFGAAIFLRRRRNFIATNKNKVHATEEIKEDCDDESL